MDTVAGMTDQSERQISDASRAVLAAIETGTPSQAEALAAWAAHVVARIDAGAPDLEIEVLIRHPVHRGIPASALFKAGLIYVRGEAP